MKKSVRAAIPDDFPAAFKAEERETRVVARVFAQSSKFIARNAAFRANLAVGLVRDAFL
jgi:hypothetical protein